MYLAYVALTITVSPCMQPVLNQSSERAIDARDLPFIRAFSSQVSLLLMCETMYPSRLVINLLFLCSVFPNAFSSHFMGGNIMVRPKPGGAHSEVSSCAVNCLHLV